MYYVYYIENIINGKIYIGKTFHPEKRWTEHQDLSKSKRPNQYIHKAIKKYGIQNFSFQVFEVLNSDEESSEVEKFWIRNLKEQGIVLYNLTDGGDGSLGRKLSNESLKKMSNSIKNLWDKNHFSRDKMSSIHKGKVISQEIKDRTSKTQIEKSKNGTLVTKIKIADVLIIKQMLSNAVPYPQIAKLFNVSTQLIYQINKGKVWSHVQLNTEAEKPDIK